MPPFWRSLLGGGSHSSSTSSNHASSPSSSSSSNSKTDAGSSTSSSKRTSSASSASLSSPPSAASAAGATVSNGSGLRQKHQHQQQQPSAPQAQNNTSTAGHSSPIVIPGQSPSSTGAHRGPAGAAGIPLTASTSRAQHSASVASTSALSGASSASYADDTDDASIPETPYSTGHSPSHARHKFPGEGSSNHASEGTTGKSVNSRRGTPRAAGMAAPGNEDSDAFLSDEEAPNSSSSAWNGKGAQQADLEQSTLSANNASPSASSPSSQSSGPNARQSPLKPDIPTTHTILANPLLQPSSGLAAAISSVLPSSTSTTSGSLPGSSTAGGSKGAAAGTGPEASGPRTFDIDDMITRLLETGYSGKITKAVSLKNSEITALCLAAREVFLSQPTLLELSPPVNIVGDVHGQYSDLIRLFEMCSFPPHANYLFLGDYVDRGKQSLETILLLLCYKVKYPENFFLLRGNHECANVTRVYGFYDECKRRCNLKIWKTFVDVFNCLPIAALVAGKIFCVHGGLSPSLSSMDDIRRISRPTDVPDYGLLNDLLWSDPSDTALDWEDNERGVSYCFGKAVIQEFLAKYDFDLICRAHMVVEDGYEFWNDRTLVTIFSAPNYCGEFDNFASSMLVNEDLLCSFELLKPLDGPALKKELAKCRKKNSAGLLLPRPAV